MAFSAQYQNELDLMLGSYFRPETLEQYGKWEDLPQSERARAKLVLGLDPAFTQGPRSGFSAFVLLARIPSMPERYFIRRAWREQFETPTHLVEAAVGLSRHLLRGQPKRSGWIKEGRAQASRMFFDGDQIVFEKPTEENGVQRLVNELMAYPAEANAPGSDDCVDALSCALLRSRGGGMRVGRSR